MRGGRGGKSAPAPPGRPPLTRSRTDVPARLFDVAARADRGRRLRAPRKIPPLTPQKYHRAGASRRLFIRAGLDPPSALGTSRDLPRGDCIVRPAGRLGNCVVGDGGGCLVGWDRRGSWRVAGVDGRVDTPGPGLTLGWTKACACPGRILRPGGAERFRP
jgi:hypothetical protein